MSEKKTQEETPEEAIERLEALVTILEEEVEELDSDNDFLRCDIHDAEDALSDLQAAIGGNYGIGVQATFFGVLLGSCTRKP